MEKEQLIRLVTRAQKGDSAAMNALFAAFYNDVYYFALKTVKDADTACDITQEAFLEIIRTVGDLHEPAAFVTWMKQITYHQCTRYFKKKKDVLADEDEDGNTIFDTLADERGDSIPAEVYEKAEFRETILGIIGELTEEQRSAVMLYYYDELTVGQIAKIQSVSEGTVKSRLNYARKAIKKSVEDYEKKNNVKLHSVSFLPLFLLFFRKKEEMPAARAETVRQAVSKTAQAAGSASAAAGAGFFAKISAMPLAAKLAAGIAALAIVLSCGMALSGAFRPKEVPAEPAVQEEPPADEPEAEQPLHTDENADGFCEHCGEAFCALELSEHRIPDGACFCDFCGAGGHAEGENHPFCGICGERLPLTDKNGNGACDICGEYSCGGRYHGGESHADADGDEKCDICGLYLCGLIWGLEHNYDYTDGIYDGKCDNCGGDSYAMGWSDEELAEPHADENGDGICEHCEKQMCQVPTSPAFGGVDADGDEKCDICKLFLCDGHFGKTYHYDFDSDEKCDRCDHYICIHGFLPHTDENGDGICDNCHSITS